MCATCPPDASDAYKDGWEYAEAKKDGETPELPANAVKGGQPWRDFWTGVDAFNEAWARERTVEPPSDVEEPE